MSLTMKKTDQRRSAGFTMAEVLVATALAGVILGGAVYMFSQSVDISQIVTNRGEMQQNARAAIDLLVRDLEVAGTGIPVGGIQLPSPTDPTLLPRIGCGIGQATCWVLTTGQNPNFPTAGPIPYLNFLAGVPPPTPLIYTIYPIMPGDSMGPTVVQYINGSGTATGYASAGAPSNCSKWSSGWQCSVQTDMVTVMFKDNNYPIGGALDQHKITALNIAGTPSVNFDPATTPLLNDAVYGLNNGDILLFQNVNGAALGLVTSVNSATDVVTMNLPNGDPLNFNQPSATSGSLTNLQNFDPNTLAPTPPGCPGAMGCFPDTTAFRVIVVTYYIDVSQTTPRLMRQVNALPPTPVAENIQNLQFSYDVLDANTGITYPNLSDPRNSGYSPNQIAKVNIYVSFRSAQQRLVLRGYSEVTLATSITPRNLDFLDRYP
jgi:type II secretory pathway pseudopilin PulG